MDKLSDKAKDYITELLIEQESRAKSNVLTAIQCNYSEDSLKKIIEHYRLAFEVRDEFEDLIGL